MNWKFWSKKEKSDQPKEKKALWKRILKWSGLSFLFLLILIILLPFLFEKQIFNYIKDEIENNLYADLECEDYSLTLLSTFPNFTLKLEKFKLTGQKEFKGVPLVDVEEIIVTFDLKSVLFGDTYDIKQIVLKTPKINIQVLKDGKANYDIAKPAEEKEEPEEPSKFAATIRSYSIENGNIIYNDQSMDMFMLLKDFNHKGEGDFTSDLFELRTETNAKQITFEYGDVAYLKNTKSDMKVNIDMDMSKMKFTFKDNSAVFNELPLTFEGFIELANDIKMDLRFKTTKSDFKNLVSMIPAVYAPDFGEYKISGKMGIDGRIFGTYSEKEFPAMDFKLDVDNGYFKYPELPKAIQGIDIAMTMKSKGDPSMDDIVIDISKFKADFGGNKIVALFNMNHPMTDPGLKASLDANINMATLKDFMRMNEGESYSGKLKSNIRVAGRMSALEKGDYDKFEAKGKLEAENIEMKSKDAADRLVKKAELLFTPQQVELADLNVSYGKTEFSANGKIDNLLHYMINGDALKGVFNFSSPLIDMREFMSEENNTTAQKTPVEGEIVESESSVFEVPKNLDVALTTKIDKLIYPNTSGKPNIELDNISGNVLVKEGEMILDNLAFKTLDADVSLKGKYSSVDITQPTVDFAYNIKNMDIKKCSETFNTVEKFTPIASKCTGKFSSQFNLVMQLNENSEPDYTTMTGGGEIQMKNIFIEGFEPLNKLAESLKISRLAKQNISDLNVSFKIKDGRYWLDKTNTKIGNFPTEVEGSTGIDQTIDYRTTLSIPRSEFGTEANNVLNGLLEKASKSGVDVKLGDVVDVTAFIRGTVTDPKIETNLKEMADNMKDDIKDAIKDKIDDKIDEVKDDAKEKASAEAQKILKDAEERAEKLRADAKREADKVREESKKAADLIREEAKKNGEKLVNDAIDPLSKKAMKKLADEGNKKAEEKAKDTERVGEDKAAKIESTADEKANKILKEAQEQADKLK